MTTNTAIRAKLDAVTSDRTRALVYSSPSNPTGRVFDRTTLAMLRNWSENVGAWVIADELYQALYYGIDDVCPSALEMSTVNPQLICISSVSKTHSLMGWRVGWAIADPELIRRCAVIQSL